jgi:hypothetical protein
MILQQTIDGVNDETKGIFEVIFLYPNEYRILVNKYESPTGKAFVDS